MLLQTIITAKAVALVTWAMADVVQGATLGGHMTQVDLLGLNLDL